VTASRRDLGARDGSRQTGIATTVVGAGRAGGHLPPGRLASPPRERHGGAEPYYLTWAATPSLPTSRGALQLPGVEVEEVAM
jgi:hypothetical protein